MTLRVGQPWRVLRLAQHEEVFAAIGACANKILLSLSLSKAAQRPRKSETEIPRDRGRPGRMGGLDGRGPGKLTCILCFCLLACSAPARAPANTAFSNWAAIVVAGDNRAHNGSPSEIFDNARRGVVRDLVASGFSPRNIAEFAAAPHSSVSRPSVTAIVGTLQKLAYAARGGCLLYFSSHGSPYGMVLGNRMLTPNQLARIVAIGCGERPAVVIVSACFSGVFVPALEAKNRLILTAARRDRSSFGCGQTDRYPYFDECVLSVWPHVDGFVALGRAARVCVALREKREHVGPPSEPQLRVGAAMVAALPKWR